MNTKEGQLNNSNVRQFTGAVASHGLQRRLHASDGSAVVGGRQQLVRGRVFHVRATRAAGQQTAHERSGADGLANLFGHQHVDDGVED